jgi:hypothetical protein
MCAKGKGFFHLKANSSGKAKNANFLSSALQSGVPDQYKEQAYNTKSKTHGA